MTEQDPAPPELKERIAIKKTEVTMKLGSIILRTKPYVLYRWLLFSLLAAAFLARMIHRSRYYTIGYIAGLYFINCLVLFVSPKFDADLYGKDTLPTVGDGDYRPFVRKLPEFLFWRRAVMCITSAHIATFFPFLDPPVYGPLLLIYLVVIILLNFRARVAHMIRNRYLPFNLGKPKYTKDGQ